MADVDEVFILEAKFFNMCSDFIATLPYYKSCKIRQELQSNWRNYITLYIYSGHSVGQQCLHINFKLEKLGGNGAV